MSVPQGLSFSIRPRWKAFQRAPVRFSLLLLCCGGHAEAVESTLFLIRHAAHGDVGHVLSGRGGDHPVSPAGRDQLRKLRERLAGEDLGVIACSPLRRARETAEAIAADRSEKLAEAEELNEVDFGEWTGRSFAALSEDRQWQAWNDRRASERTPRGESMQEVQDRALHFLRREALRQKGKAIAAVSHCDVIRAVVAGILGLSLDHILRFEIAPASITRIRMGDGAECLLGMNEVVA